MPLVTVVLTLLVVGVLLWLVNRFIPMQSTIKGILNAVVVIAVVLWLLKCSACSATSPNSGSGIESLRPNCSAFRI